MGGSKTELPRTHIRDGMVHCFSYHRLQIGDGILLEDFKEVF